MRRFDSLHPIVLLIYFLVILIPVMVVMNATMILAAIVTGLITVTIYKGSFPWKSCGFYLGVLVLVTVINAIIYPSGDMALFYIAGKSITYDGIAYGLRTGGMLIAAFLYCELLSEMLTGDAIQVLLARMPKLALLITMVLRLIPRYLKRYQEVEAAQRVNTAAQEKGRVGMVVRASAVFTFALENAMQTAEAMELRGFGNPKRTLLRTRFYRRDFIILGLLILAQAGYLLAASVPVLLVGLFPIIYAVKEEIRWAVYSRKI